MVSTEKEDSLSHMLSFNCRLAINVNSQREGKKIGTYYSATTKLLRKKQMKSQGSNTELYQSFLKPKDH